MMQGRGVLEQDIIQTGFFTDHEIYFLMIIMFRRSDLLISYRMSEFNW